MKKIMTALAVSTALIAGAGAANAGCLTGAAVGGVGGHFAGHHALLGAAAGCAVGHYASRHHHHMYRHHRY